MSGINPYEAPKTESPAQIEASGDVALWNPNAAANWSLLFSPAFGAYLHARNAERLGRPAEAKTNQIWFYVSLLFIAISTVGAFIPAIADSPFRLIGITLLLTWYFTVARKQAAFVRERFGIGYKKRSWLHPLFIGFGCLFILFAATFAVAVAIELTNEQVREQ